MKKRFILIIIIFLCCVLFINNLTTVNHIYTYEITYSDNSVDTVKSDSKYRLVIYNKTGKGVIKCKGKYICYDVKSLIELSDSIKIN